MKNETLIVLVLDRSGSISRCLKPMQSALDEFIQKQQEEPGECEVVLFAFDDRYEEVYRKPLKEVPKYNINPRGMTALHDAIGKSITSIGEELAKRTEEERPNKILFTIVTDGFENASREFTQKQVAEMIKHQQEKYHWVFTFLGANQDAVLTAGGYGIPSGNALSFVASNSGNAFDPLASYTSILRGASVTDMWKYSTGTSNASFTDEQREKALEE